MNTRLTRLIARLSADTEGSALVEAAVVFPVMIPLMLGALEFSWYFQNQQLVEAGTRDAARYLARVYDVQEGTSPCSSGTDVTSAKNIAVYGATTAGTARVSGWTAGNVTVSCTSISNTTATYTGPTTIYLVTVTTSFADPAIGFFSALNLSTPNLSASHTERSVGPG